MPHKAGAEFFKSKKEWSRRKDIILDYYLEPYLAKVAHLRRPILVVDGFAGPGRFDDGEDGSPMVICKKAQGQIARGTQVKVWCIEQDQDLRTKLDNTLQAYDFAQIKPGTFLSHVSEIEAAAKSHTVFLYLDPFTIEGVEWAALDKIFAHLTSSQSSVEVLLNFNVPSLARRGLAALKMSVTVPEDERDPTDEISTPIEKLNQFAGGDWWISVLKNQTNFADAVSKIGDAFCQRLASRFDCVCQHPVKQRFGDTIPKYILVFGSRHFHALILMNNAMVKSRKYFAESAKSGEMTLFEMRPLEVVPDVSKLPTLVLEQCNERLTREKLIVKAIRAAFCDYSETEICRCIKNLVTSAKLQHQSPTGKLNDQTLIWRG